MIYSEFSHVTLAVIYLLIYLLTLSHRRQQAYDGLGFHIAKIINVIVSINFCTTYIVNTVDWCDDMSRVSFKADTHYPYVRWVVCIGL